MKVDILQSILITERSALDPPVSSECVSHCIACVCPSCGHSQCFGGITLAMLCFAVYQCHFLHLLMSCFFVKLLTHVLRCVCPFCLVIYAFIYSVQWMEAWSVMVFLFLISKSGSFLSPPPRLSLAKHLCRGCCGSFLASISSSVHQSVQNFQSGTTEVCFC